MITNEEIKSRARKVFETNRKLLYKSAAIYFAFYIILFSITLSINEKHENLSSGINTIGGFLIFPILFANIATIASIYLKKDQQIGSFSFYKNGNFFKIFLTTFLPSFYVFLWILPVSTAAVISLLFSERIIFFILGILLIIGMIILCIYKSLQYSLTPYIVAANEEITPQDALNESIRLTKGNVGKLFLLNLSFIGWIFLVPFTLGFLLIWLIPYYNTTLFQYYLSLEQDKEEEMQGLDSNVNELN
ncbi:DUF975 family protein [Priestia aryabhattai]